MLALKDAPVMGRDQSSADSLARRIEPNPPQHGTSEFQKLEVLEDPGRVLLAGRARTYVLKHFAQDRILSLPGVTAASKRT